MPGRYGSSMTRLLTVLPLAALALAACGDRPADAPTERAISAVEAFANIPLPPNGVPAGSEGTGDALQLMVTSEFTADSVSAFYRRLLTQEPYHLINESSTAGTTSFYVESADKRPLWVHVTPEASGGSMVRLVGAAVRPADSPAPSPAPATPAAEPGE
jgi:hypothetical protein